MTHYRATRHSVTARYDRAVVQSPAKSGLGSALIGAGVARLCSPNSRWHSRALPLALASGRVIQRTYCITLQATSLDTAIMPDDAPLKPLADSALVPCALCGEPMDITHTAVAVMGANGLPGLVHPACYPTYAAQERSRGREPKSLPLYYPPVEPRLEA